MKLSETVQEEFLPPACAGRPTTRTNTNVAESMSWVVMPGMKARRIFTTHQITAREPVSGWMSGCNTV